MKAKNYFHIAIHIKSDRTPKTGIREFETDNQTEVFDKVMNQLNANDVLKLDVWQLFPYSTELQEYLNKNGHNQKHTD